MTDYSAVRNNKPSVIYDDAVRPVLDKLERALEAAEELASSMRMAMVYLDYEEAARLLPEVNKAYANAISATEDYKVALDSRG